MDDILYKLGVQLSLSAPGMGTAVGLALTQLNGIRTAASNAEVAMRAANAAFNANPTAGNAVLRTSAMGAWQSAAGSAKMAMTGLGVAALGAGITIAGAFGVGVLKDWIKAAAAMQMSMAAVQAVTGGTAQQMQALSDTAMKVSVQTMFSAADIMKIALTAAGKGIVDPALLNQMLPALSAQAEIRYRISGSSPSDTTSALIQIAHQEGVWGNGKPGSGNTPADFAKMVDTFGAAMTISGMTSAEFQNASKYALPIAKQLGVSIPDAAGLVAILANTGGSGGRGMSGIQTGLTRMIPTVLDHIKSLNRHDKALAALGQESGRGPNPFFDTNGQFIGRAKDAGGQGFLGVLKVIMDGLKDASPAQRVSELTTLLGAAGYRVLAPLFTQSAITRYTGTVEPYLTNQGSPKGAAQILYDLNSKTLLGNWTNFKTTLQNISTLLGNQLLPGIQKVVGWLHAAAAELQSFALAHPGLAKIVAWFTVIGTAAALIIGPILVIAGMLMMVAAAGVTLAPIMGAVGAALLGIGAAALPWLLPIAAGIALIALLATHWGEVMHDLKGYFNELGGSQTMKDLGSAFASLGRSFGPMGKQMKDLFGPPMVALVHLLVLSLMPLLAAILAITKALTVAVNSTTWLINQGNTSRRVTPGAKGPHGEPATSGHWEVVGAGKTGAVRVWVPNKGGGAGGGVLMHPAAPAASIVIHNHFYGADHQTQEALADKAAEKVGKILGRTIQYGSPHTSTLSPSLHGM